MPLSTILRDQLVTAFRGRICEQMKIIPLKHQAEWWLAADGRILSQEETAEEAPDTQAIRCADRNVRHYATLPRVGGRAHVITDLGAFKSGKSFAGGIFGASFACIPNGRISLVGAEYDMCAPEFEYIVEALLSERGLGIQADSLQNRPRDGRMWLDLPNGCRFEAKSWERKDSLKGKELDLYVFCEAYQLPGLECYTDFSQNLLARDGYAIFATTPDRPWLQELHTRAHSGDPKFEKWACICGTERSQNPWTYDQHAQDRDRQLMTPEKFAIAWMGQLGEFVGRVYGYQRGQRTFTAATHPELFPDGVLTIPDYWTIVGGADTGTYSSAVIVAFAPSGEAFVLAIHPNYQYISGQLVLRDMSIPEWSYGVVTKALQWGGRPIFWADKNSQFKMEVRNYGLQLLPNSVPFETRTNIAREYFHQGKIWLAPGLDVLEFELENARWPEEASRSGKFARVKDRDHALDGLEHVLSKRPLGHAKPLPGPPRSWAESAGLVSKLHPGNVHLGRN